MHSDAPVGQVPGDQIRGALLLKAKFGMRMDVPPQGFKSTDLGQDWLQHFHVEAGALIAGERACRAIEISAVPPKIKFTPSSTPRARTPAPGRPARRITASTRSRKPLASIQPQPAEKALRCSVA